MYEFVTGPLAWIAFLVFIIGMTVKVISTIRLTSKKDKVVFNHFSWGWSFRSIYHWLIPFGSRSMREKPVMTIAVFVFHIGLLAVPIFLLGHAIMWDERWGISWWSFSEMTTDYITLLMIAAALFLLVRRIVSPEVKIVTTGSDYLLLAIATAPFITGYMAYHQWFDYKTILIIHILCGEIMLIAIPFTKLSHMILFFLTRAHIGSEFGQRRGAVTW
ncbi:MAG: nitrate reductase [Deltaproteobacteria bacterium]|nr:nitrate reductase [Deltaproteobacteria bacterium]MBW2566004.1 nitrate reductase [Deltaproteobacteria bacterium]